MVGPNWPNQGEIDIYEGVNLVANNQMTLHTAPGCNPGVGPGGETGTRLTGDCGANGGSTGCGVAAPNGTTFGTPFNAYGGGVYATLWTTTGIKIWYFATRDIPADITRGTPNPTAWGTPLANFGNGGCDFAANFRDLSIVFDTTFCGDWAGSPSVWGASSCSKVNPSCAAYVAAQPQNFADVSYTNALEKEIGLTDGVVDVLACQFCKGLQCLNRSDVVRGPGDEDGICTFCCWVRSVNSPPPFFYPSAVYNYTSLVFLCTYIFLLPGVR